MKRVRMEFKTVANCSLIEVVNSWNEGIAMYEIPLHMEPDVFIARMAQQDIVADASFTLNEEERVVGMVLNGYRKIAGQLVAWMGGLVVHPSVRQQGVAKKLLSYTMAAYEAQGIQLATAEMAADNEQAIHLYEAAGYAVVDTLLSFAGELSAETPALEQRAVRTDLLKYVHFYEPLVPWMCQVESLKQAEALIFYNALHDPVGYIVFEHVYEGGVQQQTMIYQLQLLVEEEAVLQAMLQAVVGEAKRFTVCDLRASSVAAKLLHKQANVTKSKVWLHKK